MSSQKYQAFLATSFADTPVQAVKLVELEKIAPSGRDLLIKVHAFATNPVDVKLLRNRGKFEAKNENPFVAGWDGAGVIEAVGSEVKSFKVGDEVFFAGVLSRNGAFAQYTTVDERIVAKKPATLTWAQAASLPLTALTAWEALVEGLGIAVPKTDEEKKKNASKSILIIAGAGGVGSIAVQIAKRVLNLTVAATASRGESVEFCQKQGADVVINHKNPLLPQLNEQKIGAVDYVFNTADTHQYFAQVCEVLKPLGKAAFINETEHSIDLTQGMLKRLTFVWELMFTRPLLHVEPEKQGEILTSIASLVDSGVLHHCLTQSFDFTLEGLGKALEIQKSGTAIGKLAVNVA